MTERERLWTPICFTVVSCLLQKMARSKSRTRLLPLMCPRLVCVWLDVEIAMSKTNITLHPLFKQLDSLMRIKRLG